MRKTGERLLKILLRFLQISTRAAKKQKLAKRGRANSIDLQN